MELGFGVMVSTLDFGSDNPGSIPGIPTKPTRRFPGKNQSNMKFKESTELKTLADMAGLSVVEFSDTVISQLIKSGAIEDTTDCCGLTLHKALDETTHVKILVNILNNVGIEQVTERDFAAFIDLVLMGDDDCPKCGGEMEVKDGRYKKTHGDGYINPVEYTPIWEDKKCINCGYEQIGNQEH